MRILAVDSALGPCSAALWQDGRVVAEAAAESAEPDAVLVPMVAAVMAQANIAYAALDAIAVTIGPGSFTGLRVGVAAARGLSLAAGVPAIGITTFEALAAALDPADIRGRDILIAIAAGRGDVYAQAFGPDLGLRGGPACLAPADALALGRGQRVAAGNGVELLRAAAPAGQVAFLASGAIAAGTVAARAALRLESAASDRVVLAAALASPPEPLYLRRPAIRHVAGGP